jgi:hypothetical protein
VFVGKLGPRAMLAFVSVAGNANVFINKGHLLLTEAYQWAQVIGTAVMLGRYWLDG